MCHEVAVLEFTEGGVVFQRGDQAKNFFIVREGRLSYRDLGSSSGEEVDSGEWLAEAVLWMEWVYHGHAKALEETTLLVLDAAKFQSCCNENRTSSWAPSHYAALFVEHLNGLDLKEISDLRDPNFELQWSSQVAFAETPQMKKMEFREMEEGEAENDTEHSAVHEVTTQPPSKLGKMMRSRSMPA